MEASADYVQFVEVLNLGPREIKAGVQEALRRSFFDVAQPEQKLRMQDAEILANFGSMLLGAYRTSGAEELLRALLTVRHASVEVAPEFKRLKYKLALADALFDLCRHSVSASLDALALFSAVEEELGKRMCNAKIVLLLNQLDREADAEDYATPCGLSAKRLHLQNPDIPTQPWWTLKDPRLPGWIRQLGQSAVAKRIRSDLWRCVAKEPGAFDDSANDWYFVGSRHRWTGLNLMHSARGGWQRWCSSCARETCERLRWRMDLNYTLWDELRGAIRGANYPPPMYVNFYALAPGAHIIPHLGNDLRLTVHLALSVPARNQSRIRVADKTVNYTRTGQLLVFDDAYDHEVWNDAESIRYVLGMTIWHPELLKSVARGHRLLPPVPQHNFALCWRGKTGFKTDLLAVCRGRVLCNRTKGA